MKKTSLSLSLLVALSISAVPARGQDETGPNRPAADPGDVSSIGAIIEASYEVISGAAGEQRDWDRERSLFHPESRHMPTGPDGAGDWAANVMDVDGFIEMATPFFDANGFFEYEIARRVERFGNIAHVFSTYAWSNEDGGAVGGRGINSFQLMWDGGRWWIMSVFWQQESDGYPIPEEYLPQEASLSRDAETGAVSAVLDALHHNASIADGEAYFALFAPDAVFMGTDGTERWTVEQFRAYAHPFFERGRGWTYHLQQGTRNIDFDPTGTIAWFDELLDNENYGETRGTGVLRLVGGEWKIAQYNLTIPVPNGIAADVVEMIRELER